MCKENAPVRAFSANCKEPEGDLAVCKRSAADDDPPYLHQYCKILVRNGEFFVCINKDGDRTREGNLCKENAPVRAFLARKI